ncbi:MAG: DUF4349 domain-containing protein [Bacillota bacterium]
MKCELARNLMSSYIDRDINEIDRTSFEKHLQQCSDCKEEYELLLQVVTDCSSIEEAELPDGFHKELHEMLVMEKSKNKGKLVDFFSKHKWKTASGLVAAVLIVAVSINGSSFLLGNAKKSESIGAADRGGDMNYSITNSFDTSYAEAAPAAEPAEGGVNGAVPQVTSLQDASNDISLTFSEEVSEKADFTLKDTAAYGVATEALQTTSRAAAGRKVIKSGSLTIKVANLDAKVNEIKSLAEGSGGYVENSQVNNNNVNTVSSVVLEDEENGRIIKQTTIKTASVIIRIPENSFDSIFESLKAMGEVEAENINGSDITAQYRDTETAVKNMELKESKLQDLMANKATTVDEILRIETELNNVRTQIDMMKGELKRWDDLVQLSSVYISLTEIKEEELQSVNVSSLWSRAQKGFIKTINLIQAVLERTFVFLISAIPVILILGVPIITFAIIFKRRRNSLVNNK